MRRLCPHEDLDTLADALAIAMDHLINTGVLAVDDDAMKVIANRTAQYEESEFADVLQTAGRIMTRASVAH